MDTTAQERILSSLKAKGYTFDSYRDLYDYADKLDQQSYLPGDYGILDPDEQNFLEEDEVREVLKDVYAQRQSEALEKSGVNIDGMM